MTALSSEQRSRHQELGELLRSALVGARELSNGYDFEFSPDPKIYDALAEITPIEHACLSFLHHRHSSGTQQAFLAVDRQRRCKTIHSHRIRALV